MVSAGNTNKGVLSSGSTTHLHCVSRSSILLTPIPSSATRHLSPRLLFINVSGSLYLDTYGTAKQGRDAAERKGR